MQDHQEQESVQVEIRSGRHSRDGGLECVCVGVWVGLPVLSESVSTPGPDRQVWESKEGGMDAVVWGADALQRKKEEEKKKWDESRNFNVSVMCLHVLPVSVFSHTILATGQFQSVSRHVFRLLADPPDCLKETQAKTDRTYNRIALHGNRTRDFLRSATVR